MRRFTRFLLWILAGLLVLEVAYVVAVFALVQSGQVDHWLNKAPKKRTIRFESAWSVVPFVAHVGGVRVVNQGRGDQLEVVVDQATAVVHPLALLDRRVHVSGLRARGVEFRFRRRPKTPEEAEVREALVAPIEGLAFKPFETPPEAEGQNRRAGWALAVAGARIRDVREVWIDTVRLRGAGEVTASVTVGPGFDKEISVADAGVRFRDAGLEVGGRRLLQGLDLRVEGRMKPFFTKQTRGKALLPLVEADVRFSGGLPVPDINAWLRPGGGLDLRGGRARVEGHLQARGDEEADRGSVEVTATDLVVANQGRGSQLEVVVDELTGTVDPLALLERVVRVTSLDAEGVELRLRRRPRTVEEAAAREGLVAPIEGVPFEPYDGPVDPGESGRPGWAVRLSDARLRDIRELWIDAVRVRGQGELAAGLRVGPEEDKEILIRSARLNFRDAELALGGDVFVRDLDLRVDGEMEPFFTRRTRGSAFLPLVTARVGLSGRASTAHILNRYFGKADWLEFTSGPGNIRAELELEQGQIQPGGHVELVEGPLAARFAGFTVEGQARVRMDSTEPKMGRHADALVWVDFSRYGMRRRLDGPPALKGERLLMHARSSADREDFPPRKIDGQLQLGQAEFPDLAFVNDLIPPGAGLDVKGGRAVVEGRFRTGGEDASVEGLVTVNGTGLVLGAGGVEHAGDVAVAIQVPDGNLDERVFSLDGTWLGLDRFAFTSRGTAGTAPDFWARFTLTEGRLDLGQTPGLDTRLEIALSDTRPLVAFLSRDEPLAGWKEKLLTMNEITGRGDLVLTKETATFRHAEVSGGKVDIEGRVFIGDEGPLGKAIGRLGILKVGIGLAGRERNVKAFGAESWYEKDDIPGMPPLVREPTKGRGR